MSTLNLVSVTPSLDLEIKSNDVKSKIVSRLTELKLIDTKYKVNPDIILLVCNLIENLVKNKKINKKQLLLDIFVQLYNIQPADRAIIETNIEFLHSNKSIKKLSKFYLFCCSIREYFLKGKKE
jgi:hypothetical protein